MAEPQELSKTYPTKPRLNPTSKKPSSTPESKYWRSYRTHQIPNLIFPITSLEFSPTSPHRLAATFSASVKLYSFSHLSSTFENTLTLSSFKDVAYSATFRSDGQLIAAGGESGLVQVFNLKNTPLRKLHGHTRPVRVVRYPRFDKLHLFSGGDDALVKFWDVAAQEELGTFTGHKDYVRCGAVSPASDDLFASGSYDHTVKIWDGRVSEKWAMEICHGKPVEDVVFMPSGGLLATAGGNSVKIWDVIGGGKLVYAMESHNKTVTSLCVGKVGRESGDKSEEFRLLSVSLDGYMKVFDYSALKITHTMRYPLPLMSIAVSPDCLTRAIGTSNGVIYAGRRKKKEVDEGGEVGELVGLGSVQEPEKRVLRPTYFRYFNRGQSEKASEGDYLIKRPKKVKVAEHDRFLRKFRHKEALVSALSGKNPQHVVAVMEELVARSKLMKCISNLDTTELGLLMHFLYQYSTIPRYSSFLMGLTKKVIQLRAEDINSSKVLKGHIRSLKSSVEGEIRIQESLQEIQGIISPLLRIAGRR